MDCRGCGGGARWGKHKFLLHGVFGKIHAGKVYTKSIGKRYLIQKITTQIRKYALIDEL